AAVRRACATSASVRRLVSYGPPTFALFSRKYDATASITESGTCVPPGPSKKASGWRRAEKRVRAASTSSATVDIADTLLPFPRDPGDEGADRPRHRQRPRRPVERDRAERQPQHVPGRRLRALLDPAGRLVRPGDGTRRPNPRQRPRDRLVGP